MDGRQALRLLETQRFDLALVDLQMPKIDGFELTVATEAGSSVHLFMIALTAHAMKGDRDVASLRYGRARVQANSR